MFLVVRRNSIIMIALICCFSYISYLVFARNDVPATANPPAEYILIDPGHGGEDGGAVGVSGSEEKMLNLAVALELKSLCEAAEIPIIMTRETDISLGDPNKTTIAARKKDDMYKRKELAERVNTKAYIGVHMNFFEESKYRGAQVFYSPDNDDSRVLGEILQARLLAGINDGNTRTAHVADKGIFLLNDVSVPSIIIECGMLSNHEEEQLLSDPAYQKLLAECIFKGIQEFISKN